MEEAELIKWIMIQDASFLTTKEKLLLQKSAYTSDMLALCSLGDLSCAVNRALGTRCRWNGEQALAHARKAAYILHKLSISCLFYGDVDFPPLLTEMPDAPYALFYRGSLSCLKNPCVSVVGTRRATVNARIAAAAFAREAASAGCTVVSGLAFGIDVEAHKGALSAPAGATAALLASGIDTITPASHTHIARRIIENGGCIMSEYTPGTPAAAFRFVQRDRLIAALSPATVVIQAPAGSGALLTADFALEYGRDVMFHAAAFSEESKILEQNNQEKLHLQLAQGRNVSYKIENTLKTYISDGAPVIHSFAEYCTCRESAPGTVFCKEDERQMQLF